MKKLLSIVLVVLMTFGLTGCAFLDWFHDNDNVVDLGDGKNAVKWNLVSNDNEYRLVDSAYFEFTQSSFKYYENGNLKKEGTHRITFTDLENSNMPLHLNLNFGEDESGFSVFDYVDCYTEDVKENLHQFTIVSEGYHIDPIRAGGVPVRDYHLSDMPYAFGTYVKEGSTRYEYENGKVNYLDCSKLSGKFCDANGNSLNLINNSYSAKYKSSDYSKYTVYFRYENNVNNSALEGTIKMSTLDDLEMDERRYVALLHVLHGDSEPAQESGTYAEPDYQLLDFSFGNDSISFSSGEYFYDNRECNFNPDNFIGGTYHKVVVS